MIYPVSYVLGKDRLLANSVSGAARSCYAVCSQLHNITEYCQRGGTTCNVVVSWCLCVVKC